MKSPQTLLHFNQSQGHVLRTMTVQLHAAAERSAVHQRGTDALLTNHVLCQFQQNAVSRPCPSMKPAGGWTVEGLAGRADAEASPPQLPPPLPRSSIPTPRNAPSSASPTIITIAIAKSLARKRKEKKKEEISSRWERRS